MREIAEANARIDPDSQLERFSDEDIEQIVNAYEALFLESLHDTGRTMRDLVFDTALKPVLDETGQTALGVIRSQVISAVTMSHRLVPMVSEDLREEAVFWLAGFYSQYTYEIAQRVMALEAGR